MNRVGSTNRQGWFGKMLFGFLSCIAVLSFAGPVDEARSLYERGSFTVGDTVLLNWMLDEANIAELREGFLLLEKEEQLAKRGWPEQLKVWSAETGVRSDLAKYYYPVGVVQSGDLRVGATLFSDLTKLDSLPENLKQAAQVRLVALFFELEHPDNAVALVKKIRKAEPDEKILAHLRGVEVKYWLSREKGEKAVAVFDSLEIPEMTDEDLFHGALAALMADEPGVALVYRTALADDRGREDLAAELVFEEGIALAGRSDTQAFDKLAEFLRDYPDHKRAADAEIALAEKHLNQVPPQPQAARDRQASAAKRALSLEQSERLDYSMIWTERIGGDLEAVVEQASRFLGLWPRSERRPEVMLMLGRAYFELKKYPDAIEQFEKLSAVHGESGLVEVALFFAAKAASLTMTHENHEKAQTMWETVAERGGPLALSALHEKGLLYLANNQVDEALGSFQMVLENADGLESDLEIALLCDMGHALFLKALAEESDAAHLNEAIGYFEKAESSPKASTAWRYQAKVRRGKCLEALNRQQDALDLYFSIVQESTAIGGNLTGTVPMEQFDWLYRAGFSAIELLKGQENWTDAVKLAELLAETGGPRSIEATERANRLRLKHFVWE